MDKIRVEKAELLKKLHENKIKHSEMVIKAKEGYKKTVRVKLEKLLKKLDHDELVSFYELTSLPQPVDKTDEYDRAIEMLNMSVDDTIEISESEFKCYVQDQWRWAQEAFLSNTRYI